MRFVELVLHQVRQRRVQSLTSMAAVALAVAVCGFVVGMDQAAERSLKRELARLGADLFVLSAEARLSDFYTGRLTGAALPEEKAEQLRAYLLPGMQVQSRLQAPFELGGIKAVLRGVDRPPRESGRQAWPAGEGALVGHRLAARADLREGTSLVYANQRVAVLGVLPQQGTAADFFVSVPLALAQRLLDAPGQVNVIAIRTGGQALDAAVTDRIRAVVPGAKLVTARRIAEAQRALLASLRSYGGLLAALVLVVAGLQIANHTALNVRLRQSEIATLGAVGATPRQIGSLFMLQATVLGLAGAFLGCVVGAAATGAASALYLRAAATLAVCWWPGLILGGGLWSLVFAAVPSRAAAQYDPAALFEA